jgi:NTE family protein
MIKTNLVLSGGGARGIAHLGVIKALIEFGFDICAISGVSSGAIAGAFIAAGKTPEETLEIAMEHAIFNIKNPPFTFGLFRKQNMKKVLEKYFTDNAFESLKIPLTAAATNINNGQTEFFSTGELIMPLIASSALPILFSPVEINKNQYLDGGLLNNLPIEPFHKDPLICIGVHVNPVGCSNYLNSRLKIIERSIELSVYKNIGQRKHYCNLFIEPPQLCNYSTFDFSKAKDLFKTGYDYAITFLDKFFADKILQLNYTSKAS